MTTGQRIQAARKQAKLSQKELGAKLGVSGSMIGQYENDQRKPKIQTLSKIAAALGTTVGYLSPVPDARFADEHDELFFEKLSPIKPLEDVPQEVEALNMLLKLTGETIFRVDGQYYLSWAKDVSYITADDINDMLSAALGGLAVVKDILIRRLQKEQRQVFVREEATDNGEHQED